MAEHACPNCGSELEYLPEIHALKCAFCDAVQDVAGPGEKRPDFDGTPDAIIPFSLNASDAEAKAREVLAGNEPVFDPEDILERLPVPPGIVCTKIERMFIPVIVDYVTYEATWTASFGYGRRGEYVEWQPVSGTHSGEASHAAYVGQAFLEIFKRERKNHQLDREMADQMVEKRKALAFDPVFMQQIDAEPFPVGPEADYDEGYIANEIGRQIREYAAQGDRQRDWNYEWTELDSKRVHEYLPICRVTCDYRGVEYTVVLDGIDGEFYISDKFPDEAVTTVGVSGKTEPKPVPRNRGKQVVWGAAVLSLMVLLLGGWRACSAPPTDPASSSEPLAAAPAPAAVPESSTNAPTPPAGGPSLVESQLSSSGQPAGSEEVTAEGVVARGPSMSTITSDSGVAYRFVSDSGVGSAILGACPPDARCRVTGKAETDTLVSVTSVNLIEGRDGAAGVPADGTPSPSFDCSVAATDVERMICASPELSTLDAEAARALEAAILKLSEEASANGLRRSQQIWLGQVRDRCADPACLISAYKERIGYLMKVGD